MANTKQVWDGKGVLWHGRKKIRVGDRIPGGLPLEAHKSLKAKGFIKEVVIEKPDTAILDAAVKAAEEAEAVVKELDIGKLTKAVQTAKGARTKAQKVVKTADGDSGDLAAKVGEADEAVKAAEAKLTDAYTASDADKDNTELVAKAGEAEAAVTDAKTALTEAEVAVTDADKDNTELADKATEAEAAVTAAEANLADANVLAETAVRLRLDADVLANG